MKNRIKFVVCSFAMCSLMLATTHATNVVVIDNHVTPDHDTVSAYQYAPLINFNDSIDYVYLNPGSVVFNEQRFAVADYKPVKTVRLFDLVTYPRYSKGLLTRELRC